MGSLGECRRCGANERNKDGACLPCRRAATQRWRQKNSGKVKDYSRSYYVQHRERCIEYQREHNKIDGVAAKKKEKAKEKYLRHKSKMLRKTQEWRINSPAEYLLSTAKQRARRASGAVWGQAHRRDTEPRSDRFSQRIRQGQRLGHFLAREPLEERRHLRRIGRHRSWN